MYTVYRLFCYKPFSFIQLRFCIFSVILCQFKLFLIPLVSFHLNIAIWKLPEIGVPPNHPLDMGFPIRTIHFRDPPFMETTISRYDRVFFFLYHILLTYSLHCGFTYTWLTCSFTLSGHPSSSVFVFFNHPLNGNIIGMVYDGLLFTFETTALQHIYVARNGHIRNYTHMI